MGGYKDKTRGKGGKGGEEGGRKGVRGVPDPPLSFPTKPI